MVWFKRKKEGITTKTSDKKEAPDGLWTRCKNCKQLILDRTLHKQHYVCMYCNHHFRIGSKQYFEILFDDKAYTEICVDLESVDMLKFIDLKSYPDRLRAAKNKTGLDDAITLATGTISKQEVVIGAMDFAFIGGSMGSVVGEKISFAIDYCLEHRTPLIIISKSGGARMMESAYSLMQMAKTSAKLAQLAKQKIPYISLMTDPTTGGVTASFAMLGDINLAEPNALIGFAGPRVIKDTIKKDLPEGFQRSEFLLEHGFLDRIIHRKELKKEIGLLLRYFL